MKSVGDLSQVCFQIVLKCLYLARIGRPDILWSVNKLARSITKWTKACDKRLNRLISYIHHTHKRKSKSSEFASCEVRWNGETSCLPLRKSASIRQWRRRNRIRIVVAIQNILAQGEWSSAIKAKTILNRCNKRQRQTYFNMENFLTLKLQAWWRITQTICIPSKKNRSCNEKDVLHIWEIGIRTISWDISSKNFNWENFSWQYLSQIGDEQVISVQRTKVHVCSNSVLCLWKMNENPRSNKHGKKDWRGSKVHQNTELWTEVTVSQWNSSGIFSQDSPRCSSVTKFKSYCWDWKNIREFYRTDYLRVDVQRHLMGIKRQQERIRVRCSTRFPTCKKDSKRDNGHSSGLDQRKSGIRSVNSVHKVNVTKWWKRWWWNSQKADTQSYESRVHCPEECSNAKAVKNCQCTIVPCWNRFQLFFAHLLL